MNQHDEFSELKGRLDSLIRQHESNSREISFLKDKIDKLTRTVVASTEPEPANIVIDQPVTEKEIPSKLNIPPAERKSFEEIVGGNIINKVGIIVLVIGIAIFIKYAIDRNLLSPVIRITLAYVAGLLLFGIAYGFVKKYRNFSAVLFSGGLAVIYFTSYMASSLYNLFPPQMAFALMIVTTIFATLAALWYNTQIIAIYGLTGAYAIPFLLRSPEANYVFLFTYILIINAGILAISFARQWRMMNYVAFVITWAIFLYWYANVYSFNTGLSTALTFSTLYFFLFYLSTIAFKFRTKGKIKVAEAMVILLNALLIYGVYYNCFEDIQSGRYLGLMTIGHALVQIPIALFLYKNTKIDRSVYYLAVGLALAFITIAIPVQFSGNWITLLWAMEALILFFTGYYFKIKYSDVLTAIMVLLSFISLIIYWKDVYILSEKFSQFLLNIRFISSIMVLASATVIVIMRRLWLRSSGYAYTEIFKNSFELIWVIGIILAYFSVRLEITGYFNSRYHEILNSANDYTHNASVFKYLKHIWNYDFTIFYLIILSIPVFKVFRNQESDKVLTLFNWIMVFVFFAFITGSLNHYRRLWLNSESELVPIVSGFNAISVRYFTYALMLILCLINLKLIKKTDYSGSWLSVFRLCFFAVVFLLLIVELNNQLIIFIEPASKEFLRKVLMSVLWGCYGALMIYIGIRLKDKVLRIAAIMLLFITLGKIATFDLAEISTIGKTIVFVILGIILLGVSFMYQRFRDFIFKED